jgi:quinol monooxygenase YgiN
MNTLSSGLHIFARFHTKEGLQAAAAAALREVVAATREEHDCLGIDAFGSIRDPRLFYVHSRWKDEAAFDIHADLPHTVRFVEKMQPLIDHAFEVTRAEPLR